MCRINKKIVRLSQTKIIEKISDLVSENFIAICNLQLFFDILQLDSIAAFT